MQAQAQAPIATDGPQPDAQGVVTLPDGTRMVPDPLTGGMTSPELMANRIHPGVGMSALAGVANGVTFGWGDEMAAAAGEKPIDVTRAQATMLAAQRDHPVANIVGTAAGGIGAAAAAMEAAPAWLLGGTSIAGQTVAGAGLGGVMGAVQGAGDAQPGQKLQGAVSGGEFGAAVGLVSPAIAAGASKGVKSLLDYLKRTDISGIQSALGIGPDAAKIIKGHLANDDTAAAVAAMDRAGDGAMIADSSPQASQLLDTTVAAGGPAQRIAREAVDGRAAAAGQSLTTTMDTVLGLPQGVKASAKDISVRTAAARKTAYDTAYASPIDYAAPEGQAIEAVMARIPNKTLNAAVQEANDAMKAAGIKNQQIKATIGADGSITLSEMPNVQQLDFIKRALGSVADGAKDSFGRYTSEGVRANGLASDLRDAMGKAVPQYRMAVKLGGDKIAEDKALEIGRKFMQPGMTREDVATAMSGASVEAKQAAKRGMRSALDEAMANVKAVASDPNMDARQAMTAVKQFSSDANRTKAAAILGRTQADALFAEFDKAASQLALRTAISRNSATAARTAGKAAMDAIIDSPLQAFKQGKIAEGSRGIIQILTRATPADRLAKQQAIYAEVATALTEQQGMAAKSALVVVQRAMKGTPATDAQAKFVAKALTAILADGAYQTVSQSQRNKGRGIAGPQQ